MKRDSVSADREVLQLKMESSSDQGQAVSLELMVSISETLAGLVQDMLGPGGQQTMLSTHTGKVLVTRDGLTVLSSLHLAHPVARCMLQSLRSYCSHHQDGSKTFVLYLCKILKAIRDHLQQFDMERMQSRIKLSLDLYRFLCIDFEHIAKLVVGKLKSCSRNDCSAKNYVHLTESVLRTSLYSCVHKQLVLFFTRFLLEFLSIENYGYADIEQYISQILQNYDMYHSKITTQPPQKSRICKGILLETNLQAISQHETRAIAQKTFALVNIRCYEKENLRRQNVSIQTTPRNIEDFFSHKRTSWNHLLSNLKTAGVDAVLCADSMPQYVQSMCKEKNIDTQILPCEKILFLSEKAGVSVLEDFTQTEPEQCVFTASVCGFVYIGNKVNTLIKVNENNTLSSQVNHMVVCAPTEGVCDQLCSSLYKALKAVQLCLKSCCWNNSEIPSTSEDRNLTRSTVTGNDDIFDSAVLSIGSGGTFEAVFTQAISDYYGTQRRPESRVDVLIKDMIMSVPKTLHANLCSSKHEEQHQFTAKWTRILSQVHLGRLLGLGLKGDVCDVSEAGHIEPVSSKLCVVSHVLQLVVRLLRVGSVLSVRTVSTSCDHSSQLSDVEEEDDLEFPVVQC